MSFVYKNEKTMEISFPLGGIGTGCIGIAGNGRFIDWEIFNRPNKESTNGFTHIAVKAEDENGVLDSRVLNGDYLGERIGKFDADGYEAYGLGPHNKTMAGFPHFKDCTFEGKFPIAKLSFYDKKFPGWVSLTAFNPFIPLDSYNSSLPVAMFEIEFNNTCDRELTYSACFSMRNTFKEKSRNTIVSGNGFNGVFLSSEKFSDTDTKYGDLCVLSDNDDTNIQEYWYRGGWSDDAETFWRDFSAFGNLPKRSYDTPGENDTCSVCVSVKVKNGETGRVRFVLAWSFPNNYNYWDKYTDSEGKDFTWKNWYATEFESSRESGMYAMKHFDELLDKTVLFRDTLFSVTAPNYVKDAVSSTLSVLKSPTVLRLEDGSFYGWEGVMKKIGSCEGSCTHVWNYAYALPFLFPDLERSMRDLDYKYNMDETGKMQFRLKLPLGRERSDFHACVDGQMGGVIKVYRDWKISGDDEWLKDKWESVKKALEYAWSADNADKWDFDKEGVLRGRQHHTLDMELYGPSSWLQGFYVCALKAAVEMAEYLGDTESESEYRQLFEKSKKYLNNELWNGKYFFQKVDLTDKGILSAFDDAEEKYWNEEAKQIKYQIADGCEIDQVLAQWHANICGLGEIFQKEKLHSALKSVYNYNFKKSMRDYFNPWRNFCINDEGGVVICEYPNDKPAIPIPYCQETMHGFEYALASLMIQEGMVDEGFEIVKAIRDRYDGQYRNPWNEIECGSNYARSMAAFSLLNALSGMEFDMTRKKITFDPKYFEDGEFRTFWCVGSAWGIYEQREGQEQGRITVLGGEIK